MQPERREQEVRYANFLVTKIAGDDKVQQYLLGIGIINNSKELITKVIIIRSTMYNLLN